MKKLITILLLCTFVVGCPTVEAKTTKVTARKVATSRYFNGTFHWSDNSEGSWGLIEFFRNGKCRLKEDVITDFISCEGSYTVSGSKIIINWGGLKETAYLLNNGASLRLHNTVFYRCD